MKSVLKNVSRPTFWWARTAWRELFDSLNEETYMKHTAWVMTFFISAVCASAQEPQQPADQVFFNKELHVSAGAVGAIAIHGQAGAMVPGSMSGATFEYVGTEMDFGGKPVKGAPYAAEGITETTQTLADGNRIVHKSSTLYYRDTEGRSRTEQTLGLIGPWASTANPPKTIFINAPVAGVNYVLNPHEQSADKLPAPDIGVSTRNTGFAVTRKLADERKATEDQKPLDVKTESLGTQL